MTRISNILVIFALVTYSSCVTVIPLQSHRVSTPVRRNLETGDPTANIAITNVESILYSGQIQVGTPPQNFSVIFDTGFSDMIFFSNCQGCTGINQYNATISNTSEDQLFNYQFDYYTDNNVQSGEVYEDYITIGGKYTVLGEFFVLSTPIGTINSQYDGIIGLNYQGVNPQYPLTTLMQLLQIANTGIPQTFALHLTSQANQTGSTLIIGGYDIITAPNNFTYYPVVQSHTWTLAIDSFGLNDQTYSKGLNDLTITFASGLPFIVAGGSLFNGLFSQLNGSTACSNIVDIPSLYFNISGDIYDVPAASLYTAYPNGTCTLNLQSAVSGGYQNVGDTEILVGIPFLQNYYAFFDAANQMIGLTVPNEIKPQPIPPNGAGIVSISMVFTLFASFLYLLM